MPFGLELPAGGECRQDTCLRVFEARDEHGRVQDRLGEAALAVAGATSLVLIWTRAPRPVLLGTVGSLALIAAAAVVNLRLKVSLHAGFAAFAAVSMLPDPWLSAAFGVVAVAVAWSRLELRRHSLAEVVGGALLGVAVGVAAGLWPG